MNIKNLLSTMLLSAAMALQASAYTVTTVPEAPQWEVDWSYDQARPDWQEPATENFENWTVALVEVEDALKPYASADDLMAFFVDDELRGMAAPATIVGDSNSDATTFLLKVWGNESVDETVNVTLKYYCSRLNHIFSLTENYTVGEELGIDDDFIPPFTLGSSKYPVVTSVDATSALAAAGIKPAAGDMVAAFVGDECRGVSQWSKEEGGFPEFDVYQREEGESFTLMYYDAKNKGITTGVVGVAAAAGAEAPAYTITGQRVTALRKGLMIVGGKKVMVK